MKQWKYTRVLYNPKTDTCNKNFEASFEASREEMVEIFGRQGWECTDVKPVTESNFKDTQWKYWIHFRNLRDENEELPEEREERVNLGKNELEIQLKVVLKVI